MKKPDEIALYAYMRAAVGTDPEYPNIAIINDAADALGITRQRARYLVEKWKDKNYCDGGSSCVYFYSAAPRALLPWGVVA